MSFNLTIHKKRVFRRSVTRSHFMMYAELFNGKYTVFNEDGVCVKSNMGTIKEIFF